MMSSSLESRWAVLLLALAAVGCHRGNTAQGAAETFLDKYYIEIDRLAAERIATGAAAERVKSEEKLVEQARRDGLGPPSQTPHMAYEKKAERTDGQTEIFTYQLNIDSSGTRIAKEITLAVVSSDGGFRVSNFLERDD